MRAKDRRLVARLASSGAEASDEGAGGSSEEGAGRAPSSDRPLSSPATAKSSDPSLAAFVLNARQGPSAAVIATGVRRARVGGLRPQDLLLLLPPWLPGGEAPTISRSGGRVAPPPPLAGGRSRASRRDRTGPITNSRERDPETAGSRRRRSGGGTNGRTRRSGEGEEGPLLLEGGPIPSPPPGCCSALPFSSARTTSSRSSEDGGGCLSSVLSDSSFATGGSSVIRLHRFRHGIAGGAKGG